MFRVEEDWKCVMVPRDQGRGEYIMAMKLDRDGDKP
jgi:hypothetical protein